MSSNQKPAAAAANPSAGTLWVPPNADVVKAVETYVACVYEPDDLVEVRCLTGWGSNVTVKQRNFSVAREVPNWVGQAAALMPDQWYAIGVLPRKQAGGKNEDALLSRVLVVDIENTSVSDGQALLRSKGLLDKIALLINSGHGIHAYLRSNDTIDPPDFRRLQIMLAAAMGGDASVKDPARVMRVPGLINPKPPRAKCEIVASNPDCRHALNDLEAMIQGLAQAQPAGQPGNRVAVQSASAKAGTGFRNNQLTSVGGSLVRKNVAADAIRCALHQHNQHEFQEPLPNDEVNRVAASVERYRASPSGGSRAAGPGGGVALKMYQPQDLKNQFGQLKPPIIDGLLRRQEVMNIISSPKIGKTWFIHDLIMHLVASTMWLGQFATTASKVLLIDNELHPPTLNHRLEMLQNVYGPLQPNLHKGLTVMPMRQGGQPSLDLYGLEAQLGKQVAPGDFDVVVLDALYRFIPDGVDENSNSGMIAVYNSLDRIAQQLGTAVIVVHHTSKGDQRYKAVTDVGAGAGAISRAADTHMVLRPHEEDNGLVIDVECRSWPKIRPFCARFKAPVFEHAPDLDPAKYRRPGKPRADDNSATLAQPQVDLDEVVLGFLTTTPQVTATLEQHANAAGLSVRGLKGSLARLAGSGRCVQTKVGRKDAFKLL